MMNYVFRIFLALLMLHASSTYAQCTAPNTAFLPGEHLEFKLKFNWKFVWVNVGTADFSIHDANYRGQKAYRTRLITRGNKTADKLFVMRDTLESITSTELTPLYYRKGAKEGDRYYVDEAWYSYPEGKCRVKHRFLNRHGEVKNSESTRINCVYDMVSMMLKARSFDGSSYKVGDKISFPMVDNGKVETQYLIYRGKKNFKMEGEGDKATYRCLVFSFVEYVKGKEKEVVTFYITDDKNHLPVRLDMYLKFGSAKAFLTRASGVRNPQTSIIEK